MSTNVNMNRRSFLRRTTAAAVGFAGIPYFASSVSAQGTSANDRISLGFIGVGSQGRGVLKTFLGHGDCQVVAACDVDRLKLDKAVRMTEEHYAGQKNKSTYKGCDRYHDFRDLLARDDIDAVFIGTPDHWHAISTIQAAQAGKDIYCEKPLSLTVAEGKAMVKAVRGHSRVLQTGSWQRSQRHFRFACELVRNGYIGELKKVRVSVGGPARECNLPGLPTPEELDWDMWLGPAPYRPWNPDIAPRLDFTGGWANFRSYWDYAGGGMTDFGAHHFDIAQWGMGMDGHGPIEVLRPEDSEYNALTYKYENGIDMTHEAGGRAILFTGTEGKIEVDRGGHLKTWPKTLYRLKLGLKDERLYETHGHCQNFLNC